MTPDPLRQALSEALTDEVLSKAKNAAVRITKPGEGWYSHHREIVLDALLPVLAALNASATTARETAELPAAVIHYTGLDEHPLTMNPYGQQCYARGWHDAMQTMEPQSFTTSSLSDALPSPPPAAPPDKPAGSTTAPFYNIGGVDTQPPAPRRAETPTQDVKLLTDDLDYWRLFLLRSRSSARGKQMAPVSIDHLTAAAVCIGNAIAALKSPAAPSHAPPEGPRDAAPAPATCATCRFWRGNVANPTGGYCDMHVSSPPRSLVAYPREANFGCTLHQPRPVSADGAPGGEQ